MNNTNTNPTTTNKLFEDAAKKLQLIEKAQKDADKYFKDREITESKLKLLESNLKKKVKIEKRSSFGFEEKTVEKLQLLLKSLSNMDLNILNKVEDKNSEKLNRFTQTDQEETQLLKDKMINLEKENEKLFAKKKEYKKQNELIKAELESLKIFNTKLSKENQLLQVNLEDITSQKSETEMLLREEKKEKEYFLKLVKKNEQILKENEELKKIMEDKLQIEQEVIEEDLSKKQRIVESLKGNLKILVYFNEIHNVTQFLNPKEINSLKRSSKVFYQALDKNLNITKNYYQSIINSYKQKLNEINSLDLKKEYVVNDSEVERLLKEYVKANKSPGKELRSVILKALTFMAKEVKIPLGIKTNVSTTPKTINSANSGSTNAGLLGGFGSLFGGMFHKNGQAPLNSPMEKKQNGLTGNSTYMSSIVGTPKGVQSITSSGSKVSSRGMSVAVSNDMPNEIDKYDKFLISENIHLNDFYEFEYNSSDEIRNILNRFLKSNFSTDKLTAFIKEICLEYSELLYFAHKSIYEIKELELVKNALNERYRRYYKLTSLLNDELTDLKKSMLNQSEEPKNKQDIKEKINFESQYYSTLNEVNKLRELNEVNEKKLQWIKQREEQTSSEYESFKIVFLKEIRNLKIDLDETIKQRNSLRDVLIEFKNYFLTSTMSK